MKSIEARIVMALLLCFALMANASALSCSSFGVKSGDWIKYDFQESFSLGTRWQKVEVLSVTGTTVTIRETVHMSNGIEITQTETIDVASGDDFPMALFSLRVYIIPADLKIGDSIYLGEFGNRTIIGDTTRACAGIDRRVIYSNFSQYGSQYTFYWDKRTGVLMEATMVFGLAYKTMWVTETNMWGEEFSWWVWAIIIITVVCVMIASRKNISGKLRRKVNVSSHS